MITVLPSVTGLLLDATIIDNASFNGFDITNWTASGATWIYKHATDTTWTPINIVAGTAGIYASGSIVSLGGGASSNGEIQISVPNAAVPAFIGDTTKHVIANGTTSSGTMVRYPFVLQGGLIPTNFTEASFDTSGRVLLQPSQPATTFASLTATGALSVGTSLTLGGNFDIAGSLNLTGKLVLVNGGSVNTLTGSIGSITGGVGGTVGTATSVSGAVGSVTGGVGGTVGTATAVSGAVGSVTGGVGGTVGTTSPTFPILYSGTITGASSNYVNITTGANTVSGFYNNSLIALTGAYGSQSRVCYLSATLSGYQQLNVANNFAVTPSVGDAITVVGLGAFSIDWGNISRKDYGVSLSGTIMAQVTSLHNAPPDSPGVTTLLENVGTPMQAGDAVALAASQPNFAPASSAQANTIISQTSGGGGGGGGLSGPAAVTVTFQDAGGSPVANVPFTILGQGPARANSGGVSMFGLDTSNTAYTLTASATSGTLFANQTFSVAGTTSIIVQGTAEIIPPAPDPESGCNVVWTALDGAGMGSTPLSGVKFYARYVSGPNGGIAGGQTETIVSSGTADNNTSAVFLQGWTASIWRGGGAPQTFTVPLASTAYLKTILGGPLIGADS